MVVRTFLALVFDPHVAERDGSRACAGKLRGIAQNPNHTDDAGRPTTECLRAALWLGIPALVKHLIRKGADPNDEPSALQTAYHYCGIDLVMWLVREGGCRIRIPSYPGVALSVWMQSKPPLGTASEEDKQKHMRFVQWVARQERAAQRAWSLP